MKLKIKNLNFSTGVPVCILNQKSADLLGVKINGRILLKKGDVSLFSIIDISNDFVNEKEIGLSYEISQRLNLKDNTDIDVFLSASPKSLIFIKKKMNGEKLSQKEINSIIKEIVNNSLSESEISLFISSMYQKGMNIKETIFLINAILKSGDSIKWGNKGIIVDKHCIGGIPGNRTTPIVVSICASAGLIFPKSSSRAITTSAGTADVIESVARVDFSTKEIKKIIKKTNACLIWGGSLELIPADEKIISIEKKLNIDPESQLLASIMAKKLALGAKYILIDIPYGENAKFNKKRALELKKKFEILGRHYKKVMKVVLTPGDQPIGNGIGPILEMIDIIKVLSQSEDRPLDLEKKCIFLSGEILEMTHKSKKGKGQELAKELLVSGKAFEKFKEIIKAQKGDLNKLKLAKYKKDILAERAGKIKFLDNKKINSLGRITGAPFDKGAGLFLYKHLGDNVQKGEKLITLYSESKSRINASINFLKEQKPILY